MAGNDVGGGQRTPGQKGGSAERTPSLRSRSNAGVQIPADYFAQFSRIPDANYYGYHQTLKRQYPGMDMSSAGWGLTNALVGLGKPGAAWTPLITPTESDEDRKARQRSEATEALRSSQSDPEFQRMLDANTGYAYGGLVALANGGQVPAMGDGLSDSVPATIDGSQPAALSSGEFVIPADVVSGLGNGSSEAGAQRLYELMNRVRAARTGSDEPPSQINPGAMLP